MSPPRGQMFYIGLYRENVKKPFCLKPEGLDYHCLRRRNTKWINLSAMGHHGWKVGFVQLRSMHYSKHLG